MLSPSFLDIKFEICLYLPVGEINKIFIEMLEHEFVWKELFKRDFSFHERNLLISAKEEYKIYHELKKFSEFLGEISVREYELQVLMSHIRRNEWDSVKHQLTKNGGNVRTLFNENRMKKALKELDSLLWKFAVNHFLDNISPNKVHLTYCNGEISRNESLNHIEWFKKMTATCKTIIAEYVFTFHPTIDLNLAFKNVFWNPDMTLFTKIQKAVRHCVNINIKKDLTKPNNGPSLLVLLFMMIPKQ